MVKGQEKGCQRLLAQLHVQGFLHADGVASTAGAKAPRETFPNDCLIPTTCRSASLRARLKRNSRDHHKDI